METTNCNLLVNLSLVLAHTIKYDLELEYPSCYCSHLRNGDDAPQNTQESTAEMMQAFIQHLPALSKVTGENILPLEQAMLQASQQVSPGYSNLQADIYDTAGRRINTIGNEINRENALAQASTDRDVLQGPGGELATSALELQKRIDPEYFSTRENTSRVTNNLLDSVNVSGDLSGGERAEVERYLARSNAESGLMNPSQLGTIQNAMTFGDAGRRKQQENQLMAAQALGASNNFAPLNFDPFQVATGRSSMPNMGDTKFQGTRDVGDNTMGLSTNLLGQVGNLQAQKNQLESQRRDGLDRANEVVSSLPSD